MSIKGASAIATAVIVVLVAALALLGWAMLWPDATCAQPACARQRFSIAIEIDALRGVPAVPFVVPAEDHEVSLHAILASGGVETILLPDRTDVPYQASSGPLDRADLYRFAAAWSDKSPPQGVDAKVYALLTAALVSDTGEPLFGMMFDVADRRGFAVAPATTAYQFGKREPGAVALLQLRTFTHELLHALNRRHTDAAQMSDGRLTLEAPTRCIAGEADGQWFLRERPLMRVSPATIHFFQTAAKPEVLPGERGTPFRSSRASATECDDVRASRVASPALTRWELAIQRLRSLAAIGSAMAAEAGEESGAVGEEPAVQLRLQAMPAAYPLGYPVAIRVIAYNGGAGELPIKGRLNPSYGMVRIESRHAAAEEWKVMQPLAWFEPFEDEHALLAPGERTGQTVPIYFSDAGWTFPEPGDYQVRARLQIGGAAQDVLSEPVTITVADAITTQDRAALQPLLDDAGQLDDGVGRLLAFGGRIAPERSLAQIEAAADQHGDTALGGALRLTLISQRLRPPIDPLTGARPAADLDEVDELLRDTCTDSGVAALKAQLLRRHSGGIPRSLSNRAETSDAAWDGTTSVRGASQPTYSDPALQPWGPSLHFCLNESELRQQVGAAIPRLARQLQATKPLRVVIVGHGDSDGTCRYNDVLGLERAESVRRALLAAGLRARRIEVASLGERRPLDFAATSAAHAMNRRVEILVEGGGRGATPVVPRAPIVPRCPEQQPAGGVVAD